MKRMMACVVAALGALVVPGAVSAARGGTERPWVDSGVQYGTFECLNDDCSEFSFDLVGTSVGRHVGRYTLLSTTVDFSNVWTAADGDTLISYFGDQPLDPVDVPCDADEFPSKGLETFSGGTGRFANAIGSYVARTCLRFLGDPFAGPAPIQLRYWDVGTISY
jgi:hypothetical protein